MAEFPDRLITLDPRGKTWDRFFLVHALAIIGTRERDGSYDLAPKHMAMPLGREGHFGFMCTPAHHTYHNVQREGSFTVSYPRPVQIVITSLTASPRCDDDTKPVMKQLQTFKAKEIDGVLLKDAYLYLECEFERVVEGFGDYGLVIGKVIATHVDADALRSKARDDSDLIYNAPLLAYLSPGRLAVVEESHAFPFHSGPSD